MQSIILWSWFENKSLHQIRSFIWKIKKNTTNERRKKNTKQEPKLPFHFDKQDLIISIEVVEPLQLIPLQFSLWLRWKDVFFWFVSFSFWHQCFSSLLSLYFSFVAVAVDVGCARSLVKVKQYIDNNIIEIEIKCWTTERTNVSMEIGWNGCI